MADWDEGSPGDSDVVSQFPANERAARWVVKSVFGVNHHEENDADQGKHELIDLLDQAADPTFATGVVGIWNNAGVLKTRVAAGTVETFARQGVLAAPAGTRMLFQQTAAPTGWTKDTSPANDSALRFTTGTVGTGGSVAFTTAFAAGRTSNAHTLTIAEMPSHTHAQDPLTRIASGSFTFLGGSTDGAQGGTTQATGGGGGHSHGLPTFAVQYIDVIVAVKD